MSYLGLIGPIFKGYPVEGDPVVVEIGIDRGHSTLSIIQNLASRFERSTYFGCDIKFNQIVAEQILSFDNVLLELADKNDPTFNDLSVPGCRSYIKEVNSLKWLEGATGDIEDNKSIEWVDIAFIDGDHNYYTVSKELKMIKKLLKPESIIVCDDYHGKWSTRDGFYAECKSHADVEIATRRIESRSQGVKTAVDEFLEENSNWKAWRPYPEVEPVLLFRKDVWSDVSLPRESYQIFSRCSFKFVKNNFDFTRDRL